MIGSTFKNTNRLFFLSFRNSVNDNKRDYFCEYYMSLVEIKDFNTLIYNKPIFDRLVKNKQEAYEKLAEMSRNNDHTKRNLLDFFLRLTFLSTLLCRNNNYSSTN